VASVLPRLTEEYEIDLVIANSENLAGGFGVTPALAEEMFALGVDILTSGNHIWDKKEVEEYPVRSAECDVRGATLSWVLSAPRTSDLVP
jgi:calcineurin-like phosphoesterase